MKSDWHVIYKAKVLISQILFYDTFYGKSNITYASVIWETLYTEIQKEKKNQNEQNIQEHGTITKGLAYTQ